MSVIPLRKADEAVPREIPSPLGPNVAGARGRGESVPELPYADAQVPSEPGGLPFAKAAVGDSLSRAGASAASAGKRTAEVLSRPVVHLPAPAVSAVWLRHRAAAQHWNAPLVSWVRLWLWGAPHTGVTGAVYGTLWATTSPGGAGALFLSYWACHTWALTTLPWF